MKIGQEIPNDDVSTQKLPGIKSAGSIDGEDTKLDKVNLSDYRSEKHIDNIAINEQKCTTNSI